MKRQKLASMFFVAAMLAWAAAAGAVDGTIEINQAKVLAAGGFPFTIGGRGTFRLTGNLAVPASTNAINVTAPSVTIDLNGFSINGPGSTSATPIGINAAGRKDVTVENGTVTGFGTGVEVGQFGIVRNAHADANGDGINGDTNTVIESCTVNNSLDTAGVALFCFGVCVVSGNTVNGNADVGIKCSSNGCVIKGNTADANTTGILCGGTGCLITGNTAINNVGDGISAAKTTGYLGNVVTGNGTDISGGTNLGQNLCTGGVICP
jgi:parallel beta-helix repeat protein